MRLEKSPMSYLKKLCPIVALGIACMQSPSSGQESPSFSLSAQGSQNTVSARSELSAESKFQNLRSVVTLAKFLSPGTASATDIARVERAVASVSGQLNRYPNLGRVHSHEEPTWISDRGGLTALAVLALAKVEELVPDLDRREQLKKLAAGLAYLQRKNSSEYPYGAHLSWRDAAPLTKLADGTTAPSAYFRTDRAYAVQALAAAGRVLKQTRLIESAQREALGMATHLVIHGDLIRSFSPQPELASDINEALPLIAGFVSLYEVTGNKVYSDLGALATRWLSPRGQLSGAQWEALLSKLEASPSASLLRAKPVGDPVTFQYIEAEDGKVVAKAIDTLDFKSSAGLPGQLAVMRRENTFWMRFDVPTEDDYIFDLSYVQSDVGGGLVSVMMRIDGDKIFQVPLGDVDGRPIFRRKFVDGPRPLRSGPHSFGIRFSGLLMTKPALLDSVVVQPSLERREFELPDGQRLYLMRNVTDQTARTDIDHFASWPPTEVSVVTQNGQSTKLGTFRRQTATEALCHRATEQCCFDQSEKLWS